LLGRRANKGNAKGEVVGRGTRREGEAVTAIIPRLGEWKGKVFRLLSSSSGRGGVDKEIGSATEGREVFDGGQ